MESQEDALDKNSWVGLEADGLPSWMLPEMIKRHPRFSNASLRGVNRSPDQRIVPRSMQSTHTHPRGWMILYPYLESGL